jgi:hypothetical protein
MLGNEGEARTVLKGDWMTLSSEVYRDSSFRETAESLRENAAASTAGASSYHLPALIMRAHTFLPHHTLLYNILGQSTESYYRTISPHDFPW